MNEVVVTAPRQENLARIRQYDAPNRVSVQSADSIDNYPDFTAAAAAPAGASMFRDVFGPGEPEPEPLQARLDRILADA